MKQEVTPIDGFHYSTGEQFTGEYWIDGKKRYIKTYRTTTPNTTGSITKVADAPSGLNEIVSLNGVMTVLFNGQNYYYDANSYIRATDSISLYFDPNNGFMCMINNDNWKNQTLTITVIYTKTTD